MSRAGLPSLDDVLGITASHPSVDPFYLRRDDPNDVIYLDDDDEGDDIDAAKFLSESAEPNMGSSSLLTSHNALAMLLIKQDPDLPLKWKNVREMNKLRPFPRPIPMNTHNFNALHNIHAFLLGRTRLTDVCFIVGTKGKGVPSFIRSKSSVKAANTSQLPSTKGECAVIYAHRLVLASASPVFKHMLYNPTLLRYHMLLDPRHAHVFHGASTMDDVPIPAFGPKNKLVVRLPNVSPRLFRLALQYIYTSYRTTRLQAPSPSESLSPTRNRNNPKTPTLHSEYIFYSPAALHNFTPAPSDVLPLLLFSLRYSVPAIQFSLALALEKCVQVDWLVGIMTQLDIFSDATVMDPTAFQTAFTRMVTQPHAIDASHPLFLANDKTAHNTRTNYDLLRAYLDLITDADVKRADVVLPSLSPAHSSHSTHAAMPSLSFLTSPTAALEAAAATASSSSSYTAPSPPNMSALLWFLLTPSMLASLRRIARARALELLDSSGAIIHSRMHPLAHISKPNEHLLQMFNSKARRGIVTEVKKSMQEAMANTPSRPGSTLTTTTLPSTDAAAARYVDFHTNEEIDLPRSEDDDSSTTVKRDAVTAALMQTLDADKCRKRDLLDMKYSSLCSWLGDPQTMMADVHVFSFLVKWATRRVLEYVHVLYGSHSAWYTLLFAAEVETDAIQTLSLAQRKERLVACLAEQENRQEGLSDAVMRHIYDMCLSRAVAKVIHNITNIRALTYTNTPDLPPTNNNNNNNISFAVDSSSSSSVSDDEGDVAGAVDPALNSASQHPTAESTHTSSSASTSPRSIQELLSEWVLSDIRIDRDAFLSHVRSHIIADEPFSLTPFTQALPHALYPATRPGEPFSASLFVWMVHVLLLPLMRYVNFHAMSSDDLVTHVAPSGLVPVSYITHLLAARNTPPGQPKPVYGRPLPPLVACSGTMARSFATTPTWGWLSRYRSPLVSVFTDTQLQELAHYTLTNTARIMIEGTSLAYIPPLLRRQYVFGDAPMRPYRGLVDENTLSSVLASQSTLSSRQTPTFTSWRVYLWCRGHSEPHESSYARCGVAVLPDLSIGAKGEEEQYPDTLSTHADMHEFYGIDQRTMYLDNVPNVCRLLAPATTPTARPNSLVPASQEEAHRLHPYSNSAARVRAGASTFVSADALTHWCQTPTFSTRPYAVHVAEFTYDNTSQLLYVTTGHLSRHIGSRSFTRQDDSEEEEPAVPAGGGGVVAAGGEAETDVDSDSESSSSDTESVTRTAPEVAEPDTTTATTTTAGTAMGVVTDDVNTGIDMGMSGLQMDEEEEEEHKHHGDDELERKEDGTNSMAPSSPPLPIIPPSAIAAATSHFFHLPSELYTPAAVDSSLMCRVLSTLPLVEEPHPSNTLFLTPCGLPAHVLRGANQRLLLAPNINLAKAMLLVRYNAAPAAMGIRLQMLETICSYVRSSAVTNALKQRLPAAKTYVNIPLMAAAGNGDSFATETFTYLFQKTDTMCFSRPLRPGIITTMNALATALVDVTATAHALCKEMLEVDIPNLASVLGGGYGALAEERLGYRRDLLDVKTDAVTEVDVGGAAAGVRAFECTSSGVTDRAAPIAAAFAKKNKHAYDMERLVRRRFDIPHGYVRVGELVMETYAEEEEDEDEDEGPEATLARIVSITRTTDDEEVIDEWEPVPEDAVPLLPTQPPSPPPPAPAHEESEEEEEDPASLVPIPPGSNALFPDVGGEWSCHQCTLVNTPEAQTCSVCNGVRYLAGQRRVLPGDLQPRTRTRARPASPSPPPSTAPPASTPTTITPIAPRNPHIMPRRRARSAHRGRQAVDSSSPARTQALTQTRAAPRTSTGTDRATTNNNTSSSSSSSSSSSASTPTPLRGANAVLNAMHALRTARAQLLSVKDTSTPTNKTPSSSFALNDADATFLASLSNEEDEPVRMLFAYLRKFGSAALAVSSASTLANNIFFSLFNADASNKAVPSLRTDIDNDMLTYRLRWQLVAGKAALIMQLLARLHFVIKRDGIFADTPPSIDTTVDAELLLPPCPTASPETKQAHASCVSLLSHLRLFARPSMINTLYGLQQDGTVSDTTISPATSTPRAFRRFPNCRVRVPRRVAHAAFGLAASPLSLDEKDALVISRCSSAVLVSASSSYSLQQRRLRLLRTVMGRLPSTTRDRLRLHFLRRTTLNASDEKTMAIIGFLSTTDDATIANLRARYIRSYEALFESLLTTPLRDTPVYRQGTVSHPSMLHTVNTLQQDQGLFFLRDEIDVNVIPEALKPVVLPSRSAVTNNSGIDSDNPITAAQMTVNEVKRAYRRRYEAACGHYSRCVRRVLRQCHRHASDINAYVMQQYTRDNPHTTTSSSSTTSSTLTSRMQLIPRGRLSHAPRLKPLPGITTRLSNIRQDLLARLARTPTGSRAAMARRQRMLDTVVSVDDLDYSFLAADRGRTGSGRTGATVALNFSMDGGDTLILPSYCKETVHLRGLYRQGLPLLSVVDPPVLTPTGHSVMPVPAYKSYLEKVFLTSRRRAAVVLQMYVALTHEPMYSAQGLMDIPFDANTALRAEYGFPFLKSHAPVLTYPQQPVPQTPVSGPQLVEAAQVPLETREYLTVYQLQNAMRDMQPERVLWRFSTASAYTDERMDQHPHTGLLTESQFYPAAKIFPKNLYWYMYAPHAGVLLTTTSPSNTTVPGDEQWCREYNPATVRSLYDFREHYNLTSFKQYTSPVDALVREWACVNAMAMYWHARRDVGPLPSPIPPVHLSSAGIGLTIPQFKYKPGKAVAGVLHDNIRPRSDGKYQLSAVTMSSDVIYYATQLRRYQLLLDRTAHYMGVQTQASGVAATAGPLNPLQQAVFQNAFDHRAFRQGVKLELLPLLERNEEAVEGNKERFPLFIPRSCCLQRLRKCIVWAQARLQLALAQSEQSPPQLFDSYIEQHHARVASLLQPLYIATTSTEPVSVAEATTLPSVSEGPTCQHCFGLGRTQRLREAQFLARFKIEAIYAAQQAAHASTTDADVERKFVEGPSSQQTYAETVKSHFAVLPLPVHQFFDYDCEFTYADLATDINLPQYSGVAFTTSIALVGFNNSSVTVPKDYKGPYYRYNFFDDAAIALLLPSDPNICIYPPEILPARASSAEVLRSLKTHLMRAPCQCNTCLHKRWMIHSLYEDYHRAAYPSLASSTLAMQATAALQKLADMRPAPHASTLFTQQPIFAGKNAGTHMFLSTVTLNTHIASTRVHARVDVVRNISTSLDEDTFQKDSIVAQSQMTVLAANEFVATLAETEAARHALIHQALRRQKHAKGLSVRDTMPPVYRPLDVAQFSPFSDHGVVVPAVSMVTQHRDAVVEPLHPHQTILGARLALEQHPMFH